jgi:hypothetical protein
MLGCLVVHDTITPTNLKYYLDTKILSSTSIAQSPSQNHTNFNVSFEFSYNVISMF